jgi:hypothetical protein
VASGGSLWHVICRSRTLHNHVRTGTHAAAVGWQLKFQLSRRRETGDPCAHLPPPNVIPAACGETISNKPHQKKHAENTPARIRLYREPAMVTGQQRTDRSRMIGSKQSILRLNPALRFHSSLPVDNSGTITQFKPGLMLSLKTTLSSY